MSVDRLLVDASEKIRRYLPAEAQAAVDHGALLVDIRSGRCSTEGG